jgi:hypothetical protein
MLVHGFAPASNLHLGYTLPSVRSCLCGVVRLNSWPAANQKRQTVMIVTGVASDWEYLSLTTIPQTPICPQWRETCLMHCLPLLSSRRSVCPSSRSARGLVSEFRDPRLRQPTKPRANVIPHYAPIFAWSLRSLFALDGVTKPFQ